MASSGFFVSFPLLVAATEHGVHLLRLTCSLPLKTLLEEVLFTPRSLMLSAETPLSVIAWRDFGGVLLCYYRLAY